MIQNEISEYLLGLRKVESIYNRVTQLSNYAFGEEQLEGREKYLTELEFLLKGVQRADTILAIFNHNTYSTELEFGHHEFWGTMPDAVNHKRIVVILGLLHNDYLGFPLTSVEWFTNTLQKISSLERHNLKIHHCGIRYTRLDGKPIRIFSQGMPLQSDEKNNFTYTLNYVQNIHHLIKKDYPYYWIRLCYGSENQFVETFHSATKETSKNDLLSIREKEVLKLIAEDWDTKEIAKHLFISIHTVGNHRSNMMERLGARDSTALVQLAKMSGMI